MTGGRGTGARSVPLTTTLAGLLVAGVVLAAGLTTAWLANARVDAAEDARADAERALADERAARAAEHAHANETAARALAPFARTLQHVRAPHVAEQEILHALHASSERTRVVREFLDGPGNATDPALVAALSETGRALSAAHRGRGLGVFPDDSLDLVVGVGHALDAVGVKLVKAGRVDDAVTELRFNASALLTDAQRAVHASVDLLEVRLANGTDAATLTLVFAGRVAAGSSAWGVTACAGAGLFDGPCVVTRDVDRMGFPTTQFSTRGNDTLVVAVPHRIVNGSEVSVQALARSTEGTLVDACVIVAEERVCEDPRGDVAREDAALEG